VGGESLLFLTDEQLRKGIEAMFFAYRGFTADPDRILESGLWPGASPGDPFHQPQRRDHGEQPAVDPGRDQAIAEPGAADADRGRAGRGRVGTGTSASGTCT
jgi:hypothetical protein